MAQVGLMLAAAQTDRAGDRHFTGEASGSQPRAAEGAEVIQAVIQRAAFQTVPAKREKVSQRAVRVDQLFAVRAAHNRLPQRHLNGRPARGAVQGEAALLSFGWLIVASDLCFDCPLSQHSFSLSSFS